MRSKHYGDRKIGNLSYDFPQNLKNRYGFPQTTVHRDVKKQLNITNNMSPMVDSASPRKRLFSGKRERVVVNNNSLNSSNHLNQSNHSKRTSQHKNNLTIKTGSSIEALKDMLGKQGAFTSTNKHSANLKYLLQLNTEKYKPYNLNKESSGQFNLETKTSDSTERVLQMKRQNQQQKKSKEPQTRSIHENKKSHSITLAKSSPKFSAAQEWGKQKLPLTPQECLQNFGHVLSQYERTEILNYKKIFTIGVNAKKVDISRSEFNDGFDDSKGEYLYALNDHVGYRYEILEPVGKGSFGQAFKVFDHKKQVISCLKVIRNKKKFQNQALVELNILTYIKEKDEENITNIIKIKDFVIFRNHVCIICELLSINLYELIKSNNYQGLSLELIRRFAIQILNALNFLYKHKIIHCDLKPENILLKQPNKSGIKIIDFGSSCFEHERIYSYIQSRYYRAPEVIFGLSYDMNIDIWSFGCIMAELYLGYPIFPGENEQDQIAYIMEIIGVPEQQLIENAPRKKHFFTLSSPYMPIPYSNKRGKIRAPGSKDLNSVLRCNDRKFIDFLKKCFVWDPEQRIKPLDALMHEWILEGLPTEIRSQHVKYLESEQLTQKAFFSKPIQQGEQGEQQQNSNIENISSSKKQHHHVSEPEMNHEKKQSKGRQMRTLSKDKEINLTLQQTLLGDFTPQNKKIVSQSFHTSKNATGQKMSINFPVSSKHDVVVKKYQQFIN